MENKDKIVSDLQKVVKLKKAEIAKIEKPDYKTNLSLNITGGPVNLNVVNDVQILTILLAELIIKRNSYEVASRILNLDDNIYKHQGYSYEEWEHDIQARVKKVTVNKKKSDLEIIEKRLAALESKELKEQRELEDLQKLLGGE